MGGRSRKKIFGVNLSYRIKLTGISFPNHKVVVVLVGYNTSCLAPIVIVC